MSWFLEADITTQGKAHLMPQQMLPPLHQMLPPLQQQQKQQQEYKFLLQGVVSVSPAPLDVGFGLSPAGSAGAMFVRSESSSTSQPLCKNFEFGEADDDAGEHPCPHSCCSVSGARGLANDCCAFGRARNSRWEAAEV